MKNIGIIGYGVLGKQLENFISQIEKSCCFYYFDDNAFQTGINNSRPFNSFLDLEYENFYFLVGLGYKHLQLKSEIIDSLLINKRKLQTFIHPTAIIDRSVIIEDGTVIYPNVTIDKNVHIGNGCIVNLSCTIAHDTILDSCCFLGPSVTISGFVEVGKMVFVGTGSCIANGISIKRNSIIGIGTVVTKDISEYENVIGNPQKKVNKINLI